MLGGATGGREAREQHHDLAIGIVSTKQLFSIQGD